MILLVGVISWKVINLQLLSLDKAETSIYLVFEKAYPDVVTGKRWCFLYSSVLLSFRTLFLLKNTGKKFYFCGLPMVAHWIL